MLWLAVKMYFNTIVMWDAVTLRQPSHVYMGLKADGTLSVIITSMCPNHPPFRTLCFYPFSADGCVAPVNIICGGGVTQTVPVTASSEHSASLGVQQACLDNEGETAVRVHTCIVWMRQQTKPSVKSLS